MAQTRDASRKNHRFHVCLSDAELKEIDDWRLALRIPTRAEAVRRMIAVALPKCREQALFARVNVENQRRDAEQINSPGPEAAP